MEGKLAGFVQDKFLRFFLELQTCRLGRIVPLKWYQTFCIWFENLALLALFIKYPF